MKLRVDKYHKIYGSIPSADSNLNIYGKEKRGICSFQCSDKLWQRFRKIVDQKYGKYKQSSVLESLIRKYVEESEQNA